MVLPFIVVGVLVRITPLVIALVRRALVKAAMKEFAKKWPAFKIAINTASSMKDIAKDAENTQKKANAYYTQLKVVDAIREDIKIHKDYIKNIEKTIKTLRDSIATTQNANTRQSKRKLIKTAQNSIDTVNKILKSLNDDLDDETVKLDPLALDARDAGVDLIKTVAEATKPKSSSKKKKKKGSR